MAEPKTSDGPPVDITKSRYDLSTYSGRLKHFISVTSPLTLLYSKKSLREAQQLLEDYKSGNERGRALWGREEEAGVWKAKQLVDSSIHPDTGEPVLLPFRMSAYVPTNMIVCLGMLTPDPTIKTIVFWQWINQSLNVCVNYSNANKSVPMNTREVATAYVAATSTSVGIAVGLSSLVPRLRSLQPTARALLSKFIPFVSVASAGCVNVGLMRWKEIRDGISIFPPASSASDSKEPIGLSSKAGVQAIGQTAASRVMVNIPTLIIPPVVITLLERKGYFHGRNGRRWNTATNLGLITASLFCFLPPAIAYFPQRASIPAKKLEPQFHDLKDQNGTPMEMLEFNKGL